MSEPPLRRADWRFLMPAAPGGMFRHLVVLGGPAGLAERLVEIGAAARVSITRCSDESADGLVILEDADVTPRAVAQCLAPDGVLYWEVNRRGVRRFMRGRGWIGRQLRRAGLQPARMYWVIPEFGEARRYLPLDDPAPAIEWFFATRFVASSPLRLGLALMVTAAGRMRGRVAATLAPCCSVMAVRAGRPLGPASVFADLAVDSSLGPNTQNVLFTSAQPVLFTSGQDDGSRVVGLPFAAGARAPAVVLKMTRLPGFTGYTAQEQATLTHLRSQLGPELRLTLPQPLGIAGSSARLAFVETLVPGRMLAASIGRWRAPAARQLEDLRVAAEWLTRFHLATVQRRVEWSAAETQRWIEPRLRGYERAFGLEGDERELFAALRERASGLAGEQIPIVWVHNDFNPWHIYRDGGQLSVIDWEFGSDRLEDREGLPLCDMVYFATHWMNLSRGLKGEAAQFLAFSDLCLNRSRRDARSQAARREFDEYLTRLEVNEAFLPLLIAYTWLERALDRHRRQETLGAPTASPRRNNRFVQYVEILARARHELFADVSANA
jgi:hypothetical protein